MNVDPLWSWLLAAFLLACLIVAVVQTIQFQRRERRRSREDRLLRMRTAADRERQKEDSFFDWEFDEETWGADH